MAYQSFRARFVKRRIPTLGTFVVPELRCSEVPAGALVLELAVRPRRGCPTAKATTASSTSGAIRFFSTNFRQADLQQRQFTAPAVDWRSGRLSSRCFVPLCVRGTSSSATTSAATRLAGCARRPRLVAPLCSTCQLYIARTSTQSSRRSVGSNACCDQPWNASPMRSGTPSGACFTTSLLSDGPTMPETAAIYPPNRAAVGKRYALHRKE